MNKIMSALTMTGMAVIAGATLGAGAADAAPAHPAPVKVVPVKVVPVAVVPVKVASDHHVAGYFSDPRACHRAGEVGRSHHRWYSYDCVRVHGSHRWALVVEDGSHGHGRPFPHGHDNGHDNGHGPDHHGHR